MRFSQYKFQVTDREHLSYQILYTVDEVKKRRISKVGEYLYYKTNEMTGLHLQS